VFDPRPFLLASQAKHHLYARFHKFVVDYQLIAADQLIIPMP
jgi:hypothetical protein